MRKILGLLIFVVLATLFIAACSTSGGGGGNSSDNTVGLTSTNFAQSSITIKKGQSVTLDNQGSTVHIIANGSWQGNTPDPKTEPGAPVVNNAQISSAGQTLQIGPFNTAGTFHYYCSVHPGMNLSVVVQ